MNWGLYARALSRILTSGPRFIEPGQERCFDEMCYSVKNVTTTHILGSSPNQITAEGVYYVVTIQLRNDSKHTAQKPSRPYVFLMDAQGKRFSQILNAGNEIDIPTGQPMSAAQLWAQKIKSGESASRTIAFDLPLGISQPGLVITEGVRALSAIIIGDEGSVLQAKTAFLLNPRLK